MSNSRAISLIGLPAMALGGVATWIAIDRGIVWLATVGLILWSGGVYLLWLERWWLRRQE